MRNDRSSRRFALRGVAMAPTLLVVVAAAVLVSLLVGTAAGSSPSAKNGKFSFAGVREAIWVMNADGSGKKALTRHVASDNLPGLEDAEPVWSPNGTVIAFTRSRQAPGAPAPKTEIDVMNANGSGQTRITRTPLNDHSPAWSPDGKKIAFVRDRILRKAPGATPFPYGEIYVMNANGSNQTRLTQVVADPNNISAADEPSWSPDGTRIAYTSQSTEYPNADGVYAMNADGSGRTRLTREDVKAYHPAWSPDGSKIAFTSENLDLPYSSRSDTREIYVMSSDGSGQTRLTQNDNFCPYRCPNGELHVQPAWSPDGTKIAFTRYISGKTIHQRSLYDLFVMNANGSGQTMVTRDIVARVDWGPVPTGAPNPLRAPPRKAARPSLRLRCLRSVPAVPGPVFEARVVPSAGIRSVNFHVNGRSYGQFSIPPIFLRMPLGQLPKRGMWTVKAVVVVVADEAQTAWVKRVLTKRHASHC